jgi:sulfite dehydrogenase (cytochrome) subunit B
MLVSQLLLARRALGSWTMRWMLVAAMTATAMTVTAAQTAEQPVELKRGAGLDKVSAHCNACHSLDYIPMNAGFLDFAGWDAEVAKMIKTFGAPVDQADAKMIAEYLGANYGSRPQPAGPHANEGGPRQRYESGDTRPKAPAEPLPRRAAFRRRPPPGTSWSTGAARGSRAPSRRHPEARGPFEALFAMFAESWTCKPAKAERHRARAAACESRPRRASESGRREVRLR